MVKLQQVEDLCLMILKHCRIEKHCHSLMKKKCHQRTVAKSLSSASVASSLFCLFFGCLRPYFLLSVSVLSSLALSPDFDFLESFLNRLGRNCEQENQTGLRPSFHSCQPLSSGGVYWLRHCFRVHAFKLYLFRCSTELCQEKTISPSVDRTFWSGFQHNLHALYPGYITVCMKVSMLLCCWSELERIPDEDSKPNLLCALFLVKGFTFSILCGFEVVSHRIKLW